MPHDEPLEWVYAHAAREVSLPDGYGEAKMVSRSWFHAWSWRDKYPKS